MRATTKAIAAALLFALAAHAPVATADGGSATRLAPSLPAVAATLAAIDSDAKERTGARVASTTKRRCRSTARRRLAGVRRAALTKRERTTARKRVRRKLRRCLSAARGVEPSPTPGEQGPPEQPPSAEHP